MSEISNLYEITPEFIALNYKAAMDSVNLINGEKLSFMNDVEWNNCLKRNKEHLKIMLEKTYWTNENLNPFIDASK